MLHTRLSRFFAQLRARFLAAQISFNGTSVCVASATRGLCVSLPRGLLCCAHRYLSEYAGEVAGSLADRYRCHPRSSQADPSVETLGYYHESLSGLKQAETIAGPKSVGNDKAYYYCSSLPIPAWSSPVSRFTTSARRFRSEMLRFSSGSRW
jgi:hypothetical protein